MGAGEQEYSAVETEMLKCELIEGLQRAIDGKFRRLFETARNEWERSFVGKDPSDACVSVHINATGKAQVEGMPYAGFLAKPVVSQNGKTQPRLA